MQLAPLHPDTPPFLLASWRMQSTSVILAVGAGYQGWKEWKENGHEGLLRRWIQSMPLMVGAEKFI
jgi:hypothetical protein